MNKFLKTSLNCLKKTDKVILDYYKKSNFTVTKKIDKSPVTEADRLAEGIIISEITKHFPDHEFFGEETGGKLNPDKYTWIIDPIDGTKNFIKHIPYFSTLIALVKNSKVVLGISHAPALKTTMYAVKGKGAYLNGQKVTVSKKRDISGCWLGHGGINYFAKIKKLSALGRLSSDCSRVRGFGDFWIHELVAQGKFEAGIDAKIKFWDIAAFKIIIEEAGGKVTDLDGNKFTSKSTTVLATNGHIHNKILKYFK